jgi:hypothetical protein
VTLIKLCGYIVLFSITAKMLLRLSFLPKTLHLLLIGATEVTNGIAYLAAATLSDRLRFVLGIMCLSFGGMCGFAQTSSMLAPAHLSFTNYLKWKIIYTLCSTCAALVFALLFL